jgi:hypothetical protein
VSAGKWDDTLPSQQYHWHSYLPDFDCKNYKEEKGAYGKAYGEHQK